MRQKAVRILGIDPGLNHTGYGFVDFVPGHFTYVASGVLNVPAGELSDRLGFIFKSLSALIEEHHPNVASIEKTFLNTNAQSSMLLSHARGAAMCAVACHSILCKEISTREIKKSVTGYGAADKDQVQQMVLRHLKLEDTRFSPDESDALATAICYGSSSILLGLVPTLGTKAGSSGTGVSRRGSSARRSRNEWTKRYEGKV